MGGKALTRLRVAVLVAGGLGGLFSLGVLIAWWRIPAERRDGFELIGVALAVVVLVLASDTLWHWLPW